MIVKKAAWQRPKLVVLVRTRPEEGVLDVCKKKGLGINGPGGYDCPAEDPNTKKPKCQAGAKS